ncbi:MAG: endonuclease/exonuclease/phosphatase family protein [Kofleriaceae bacterium]
MLRVMTYNVLYGCHERVGTTFVYQPARAEAVREVVRAEAPDILGLTEAAYCGAHGRLLMQDFAAMFGLPHVFAAGGEGDWTSMLLSRHPIVDASRIPLGGSPSGIMMSALRTTIDAGSDGRWRFDLVHPSPHISEAARVEAFAPLLEPTAEPRVVFGDFNALSDEDPYTHAGLVEDMRGQVDDPAAVATTMLDRQLLATLRAHGLRDTMPVEARVHTIPTRLTRASTQGARLRIDYVLASANVEVLTGKVIHSAPADRGSDHYPIVAELSSSSASAT